MTRSPPGRALRGGVLFMMLSASRAFAQAPAPGVATAAQTAFDQARALVQAGNYTDACPKFAESERLAHGTGTLLNLADCYDKLGRTASAWQTFIRARDSAHEAAQAEREKLAGLRASVLEGRLVRLQVTVSAPVPSDLHVFRESEEIPALSWNRPLPVDPGQFTVRAERGARTWSTVVSALEAGKTVEVPVPSLDAAPPIVAAAPVPAPPAAPIAASAAPPPALAPAAAAPAPAPPPGATPRPDRAEAGPSSQKTWGYVTAGIGVAGLAVSGIFSGLAVSKNKDSEGHCRTKTFCTEQGLSERTSARSDGNVATAAFVVGIAGVGTGLALLFTAEDDKPAVASKPKVSATASARGGGVTLAVEF